jgi:hypothetical protein
VQQQTNNLAQAQTAFAQLRRRDGCVEYVYVAYWQRMVVLTGLK